MKRRFNKRFDDRVMPGSLAPKSCEGKQRYSLDQARAAVKRIGSPFVVVYECKLCGRYHVGHERGSR